MTHPNPQDDRDAGEGRKGNAALIVAITAGVVAVGLGIALAVVLSRPAREEPRGGIPAQTLTLHPHCDHPTTTPACTWPATTAAAALHTTTTHPPAHHTPTAEQPHCAPAERGVRATVEWTDRAPVESAGSATV